jgi:putative ABC transport system substrate-binding protein
MKRSRVSLILVVFALIASGVTAEAQQARKIWRIGYLSSRSPAMESARFEPVRLALRDLGYIEGQNIAIEYRYSEGKRERFPELAAELVRLKVDVIVVAGGDPSVRAAMNATSTIPIVMTGGGSDPVEVGVVKSLARPGGNITGITNLGGELGGKRLELLKEAIPNVRRVAVLYDLSNPSAVQEIKEDLPIAARELKLTVKPWEIRSLEGLEKLFAAQSKERPDGLYVTGGAILNTNRQRIVNLAAKSRLPAVYSRREYVDEGGLMYYGADLTDSYRQVAWYIDRILKGTKPADLPVQQPMKFEFVINLKTAKQIGIEVPQWTLMKADRVIR